MIVIFYSPNLILELSSPNHMKKAYDPRLNCTYIICKTAEIEEITKRFYNIEVDNIVYLDGFEDMNVRLFTKGQHSSAVHSAVLKLSPLTQTMTTEWISLQTTMMRYLTDKGLRVSSVICTVTDSRYFTWTSAQGRKLVGRLLTYIDGMALQDIDEWLPLMEDTGRFVGEMDVALKEFVPDHKYKIETEWGLSNTLLLRDMLPRYCSIDFQEMGGEILLDFETRLLPLLANFQSGYIHGDITGSNIYVIKNGAGNSISGLIDFGDACHGTYVFELAILMADVMAQHPILALEAGRRLLRGFNAKFKLTSEELSCLRLCICVRLLQCYILTEKAALANPSNRTYITRYQAPYMACCRYIRYLNEDEFYREVVTLSRL